MYCIVLHIAAEGHCCDYYATEATYLQAVGPVTALFITLVVVSGFADSRGSGSCVDADGAIEIIWLFI